MKKLSWKTVLTAILITISTAASADYDDLLYDRNWAASYDKNGKLIDKSTASKQSGATYRVTGEVMNKAQSDEVNAIKSARAKLEKAIKDQDAKAAEKAKKELFTLHEKRRLALKEAFTKNTKAQFGATSSDYQRYATQDLSIAEKRAGKKFPK